MSAELKDRNYLVVDEDVDYKYLVRLPMDSVTEENVEKKIKEEVKSWGGKNSSSKGASYLY